MTSQTVVQAAPKTATASSSQPVSTAGDHGAKWRRRIAYVLLIAYALLMFVPFAWSISTSFKTLPDPDRGRRCISEFLLSIRWLNARTERPHNLRIV